VQDVFEFSPTVFHILESFSAKSTEISMSNARSTEYTTEYMAILTSVLMERRLQQHC
jgi:hypothetical protein